MKTSLMILGGFGVVLSMMLSGCGPKDVVLMEKGVGNWVLKDRKVQCDIKDPYSNVITVEVRRVNEFSGCYLTADTGDYGEYLFTFQVPLEVSSSERGFPKKYQVCWLEIDEIKGMIGGLDRFMMRIDPPFDAESDNFNRPIVKLALPKEIVESSKGNLSFACRYINPRVVLSEKEDDLIRASCNRVADIDDWELLQAHLAKDEALALTKYFTIYKIDFGLENLKSLLDEKAAKILSERTAKDGKGKQESPMLPLALPAAP